MSDPARKGAVWNLLFENKESLLGEVAVLATVTVN